MYKAVIIDDEINLRDTNRMFLEENFPSIEIVGEAGAVEDSIKLIDTLKPDIVLLDIELEDGTCFKVLNGIKHKKFKLIMITAYNQYAIKAIKFNAIDYVLKPVNEVEFCSAIERAVEAISSENLSNEQEVLIEGFEKSYNSPNTTPKLILRTAEALHFLNLSDIIYCKSDNSYTTFYTVDNKQIVVSKGLNEIKILFDEIDTIRPHRSYIVNVSHIKRIMKENGSYIIVKNGDQIPISTRSKHQILDKLKDLHKTY